MMEAATEKPPAFDVILVHSFSRFFCDHFELEFYVRCLNKHGVKLVSRTHELGDDPTSVLMRQIMALFDEYQSHENAKHVSLDEGERAAGLVERLAPAARLPRGGGRAARRPDQEAPRDRPAPDRHHPADVPPGAHRRERQRPDGRQGHRHLPQRAGYPHRDGGRFGLAHVDQILTRTTYAGRHRFNTRDHKTKQPKPETEVLEMAVPANVDPMEFAAVQERLRAHP